MEYKITVIKSGSVSSFKMSQRATVLQYIEGLVNDGIAFSFVVVQGYRHESEKYHII